MRRHFIHFLTVVAAAFAAASCGIEGGENTSTDLTISVDSPVIRCDGQSSAKIVVKLGGTPVTEGVSFYDGTTNKPVEIPNMTFTTTTAGLYSFWATYKTFHTEKIKITAIESPLPELPADPQPGKTSFVKKVFITQFTGTACGYCPKMISILEDMSDETPEQFILAACHTYNDSDPAFLNYSIDNALSVSGYPTVVLNLDKTQKFNDYTKPSQLKGMVASDYGDGKCGVGISASSVVDGQNLVVKAQVKVATSGRYRIGAWLLEDGIAARQEGLGNIIHNNCVRDIYSKNSAYDYTGPLHIVEAGETAVEFFMGTLDSKWVKENCHIVVFACAQKENGNYVVANVIDFPMGQSHTFAY